jgi:hypothetical protein
MSQWETLTLDHYSIVVPYMSVELIQSKGQREVNELTSVGIRDRSRLAAGNQRNQTTQAVLHNKLTIFGDLKHAAQLRVMGHSQ